MKEAIISNIFMIMVAVGYTLYIGRYYIKLKKLGGAKLKEYDHKSGVKTTGYIMIVLGLFYVVMFLTAQSKTPANYVTAVLFLYFIVLVSFISIRKIFIYENGVYYSGKFILFSDVASIDKVNQNGIQLKLNKKSLSDMMYFSKVQDENKFIGDVRQRIKSKKRKKK